MTAGRTRCAGVLAAALLGALCALPVWAASTRGTAMGLQMPAIAGSTGHTAEALQPISRSGRDIYNQFRDGLSDQECAVDSSDRWRQHFAHVPRDLAERPDRLLPLFGYVVDALREYHLPTEYALIPFVESGYRPGARSPSGPTGLWQFITATARNHEVTIRPGYDGRLSPVESTTAAVRYLRTLHGMFAGDWRLAVMGYNAGEYRIFGALRNAGQRAMDAEHEKLAVPPITRAYVRKLQALACLLVEAGEREEWLEAIDQTVPVLAAASLPANVRQLDTWANRRGLDPALVRHFNPVFANGNVASGNRGQSVLAPAPAEHALAALQVEAAPITRPPEVAPGRRAKEDGPIFLADASDLVEDETTGATMPPAITRSGPRVHTVTRGESIWRIARHYGLGAAQLLLRNGLEASSVIQPGMVLQIDEGRPGEQPHMAN
ncbi:transglycosylase SLT domain-containing protein [Luteimonas sp. A478]